MLLGDLVVIDAIDDSEVGAVRRGRDQDALGARREMDRGLLARGEDAGALHRDVDAEVLVRQFGRVLDRRDLDLVAADVDHVAFDHDFVRETPVNAVETQQMRVGFHRSEVVDRDDLDVLAARFDNRAQHEASDASKAVDRYLRDHRQFSLVPARCSRPAGTLSLIRPLDLIERYMRLD